MFYLIDKPVGISSFFALGKLKRVFEARRIGHTGTLDPLASGLLLVATEGSTKLIPFLEKDKKTYEFTFDLSRNSPSLDLGTETTEIDSQITSQLQETINTALIEKILILFRGKIEQIPPAYSAIRIDGKRAYHLARKWGDAESIGIESRKVEVFSLELLEYNFPFIKLRAEVSAGTYIRSLARDITAALGEIVFKDAKTEKEINDTSINTENSSFFGGVVTELRRTKIENLDISQSTPRNDVTKETPHIPYEVLFPDFGILMTDESKRIHLLNGVHLPLHEYNLIREAKNTAPYLIRIGLEEWFFLAEMEDGIVKPKKGRIEG